MKKRFLLLMALTVLSGVALLACATMHSSAALPVPLPQDVQVFTPDPGLPPEIKAFSGKWGGRWEWQDRRNNDGVDGVLIVEKIINEQQAMVVAATGTATGWRTNRAWERSTAKFSKNEEGIALMADSLTSSRKVKYRVRGVG